MGTLNAPPYEIIGELGRGGMGVVYRAHDPRLGRDVALKVLGVRSTPGNAQRFEREGELAASLIHPGIVKVHASGTWNGCPYLAYELVTGAQPLTEAVEGLDVRGKVSALRDAARALGAAHAMGVVHRDVKPDNILVDPNGRVRVTDFGVATAGNLERLTRTGALVGTPSYMAPEQISGQHAAAGPAIDVWALGVILFELLTGEQPFEGGSLLELMAVITDGETPSIHALASDVPEDLVHICEQALDIEPAARYASGDAMADDLDAWLGGSQVNAAGLFPLRSLARRWRSSGSAAKAAGLGAVLGCAAITLAIALSRPVPVGPPEEPSKLPAPASRVADPAPAVDPEWLALGERRWKALLHDASRTGLREGAHVWLKEFRQHPLADAVEAEVRRRVPVLTLTLAGRIPNRRTLACFVEDALIVSCENKVYRYGLDGLEFERKWVLPNPTSSLQDVRVRGAGLVVLSSAELYVVPSLKDAEGRAELGLESVHVVGTGLTGSRSLFLSPDGQLAWFATAGRIIELQIDERRVTHEYEQLGLVESFAVTADGAWLVAASSAATPGLAAESWVEVWSLTSRERVAKRSESHRSRVWVSPDAEAIVVSSKLTGRALLFDRGLAPLDVELLVPRAVGGVERGIYPFAFTNLSPRRLVTVGTVDSEALGRLSVWSWADGRPLRSSVLSRADPLTVRFDAERSLAAVCLRGGVVEVWDLR